MKLVSALAAAALMGISSASAAVINITQYIDNTFERGLNNGDQLVIDGVNLEFAGYYNGDVANAYLDEGNAGVGVCHTGLTANDQCVVSSDDNVTAGEVLNISFVDGAYSILGLVFRDANHRLLSAGDGDVTVTTYRGGMSQTITADIGYFTAIMAGEAMFTGIDSFDVAFAGTQVYLSIMDAVEAPVPLPAALPLFISALGAGAVARRRKSAKA